ncbi:MAG: DUF2207 domain-containing protein [Clostridia bacterium]|nr:DUF2207 domain-containing protein [Clostridia bacterium]
MKKATKIASKFALLIAALFLMLAVGCAHVPSEEIDNAFYITDYSVTMSVSDAREIETVERISVRFMQQRSGIIRDFDLTGGVRYRNLSATRNGTEIPLSAKNDSPEMLSFYLGREGDYLSTSAEYLYEIRYVLTVPALAEEGHLPLDVLGFDWLTRIEHFTAKITLPAPIQAHEIYSGRAGTTGNSARVEVKKNGNTVFLSAQNLSAHCGITLDMRFGEGALKAPPADFTPLWALLAGGAVLLIFAAFRLRAKQPLLTSTVNFTAPDEMDPLEMGTFIDSITDSEDIGAIIFWFAAEGYLTIDFSGGESDPLLIRTEKPIPNDMPAHRKTFLGGLFRSGSRVQVSALRNNFYTTVEAVKITLPSAGKRHNYKRYGIYGLFTFLSVAILGAIGWLCSLLTVGTFYHFWQNFVLCLFAFAVSASASHGAHLHFYKWGKGKVRSARIGGMLLGCALALFALIVRSPAFSPIAVAICVVCAALAGMGAPFLLVRTAEYTKKLGQILGFRDFILYTERDKLAVMLKENPELYYRILPYAQVLGITNVWTEKFSGLDMAPPAYVHYGVGDRLFTALVYSRIFRSVNANMSRVLVSRPSNTGGRRGFGGGFGGRGGGGFGGGGGRSF